jgi:sugar phosphate isomerase/epimerase
MKRRRFLQTTATALAVSKAQAADRPRIRFGACDWTLKLATNPESLDLARRIGLDGVQVDFGSEPAHDGRLPLFDEALQDRLLQRSADTGVAIPSLAMGVLNRHGLKNSPDALRWTLEGVKVARRMKTPVVLLAFFGNGDLRNDDTGTQAVIAALKKLAPPAAEAGITYGIESWLKVDALEHILDAVKSPAIQVYYDVGNMQKEGEDYAAAIRRLGRERICETHAKDYGDLYGRGSTDFVQVRDALHDIGYSGWMHIEGVKVPNGIEQDIGHDLGYLRSVFS